MCGFIIQGSALSISGIDLAGPSASGDMDISFVSSVQGGADAEEEKSSSSSSVTDAYEPLCPRFPVSPSVARDGEGMSDCLYKYLHVLCVAT